MKTRIRNLFVVLTFCAGVHQVAAQSTAFTYQGRLNNGTNPANGNYDLTFSLFTTGSGGSAVAGPVTTNGVIVTNGLFTVTMDFGASVWNGTNLWLQIGVETNGAGTFTPLAPRQMITPTPYANFAAGANAAGISGTIPAANVGGTYGNTVSFNNGADSFDGTFSGQFFGSSFIGGDFVGNFIGNGSGLTDVWQTDGNSGTTAGANFLGTTDNQPLELHVDAVRALRLEPDTTGSGAPNVIGGSPANFMDAGGVIGGFIGGGGALNFNGVGYTNRVSAYFGSIVGGYANWIQSYGNNAFIGGGYFNTVQGASGWSVIGGGQNNTIETNNYLSVIGGGQNNIIGAPWAVIAGGYYNTNAGEVSFIGAGDYNNIQAGSPYSVIGGGFKNIAAGIGVFVGGGGFDGSTFAGNQAYANASTIGGGLGNNIQFGASYATIGGGQNNFVSGISAFIGGGGYDGSLRAGNQVYANASTIGGGVANSIQSYSIDATIGGGINNVIQTNNLASTIGGGFDNQIQSSTYAAGTIAANTIAGGNFNIIQSNALYATIAGGTDNQIGGGGGAAFIGGGNYNTNNGTDAVIPGGTGNLATGSRSFAAGLSAQAVNNSSFVWSDGTATTSSTANNQFVARASGGFVFYTAVGNTVGAELPSGSGSWTSLSDRNAKQDFVRVDSGAVLTQVASLPMTTWSYKTEQGVRHLGPMAQDFYSAFRVGEDDRHIAEVDEGGVALAAIQGLNQKLNEKDAEIQGLKQQNESLEKRLDNLEHMVKSISDKN
jgi:hypothetical protein